MKTKISSLTLSIAFLAFIISACKKNDTGGEVTIVAHTAHHSKAIKGSTVYVKFKAEDLPSNPTTNYDLKIEGDTSEDHVHIKGLRYGKYYLYAVGYDPSIQDTVTGGVAVKIKWSERKDEREINIPVTE